VLVHERLVQSAVFSPDGEKIVTAYYDKARIWDVQSRKKIADLTGHQDAVNSAVFSPDGKKIVTASNDNTARLWLTPEGIIDWLGKQKFYRLTQKDLEKLGIDFIKLEKQDNTIQLLQLPEKSW
jgi:WD40 repeat protein